MREGEIVQDGLKAGEPMKRGVQITAPYFVAGIEFDDSHSVCRAAPIVKYMKGWHWMEVLEYCQQRGWGLESL